MAGRVTNKNQVWLAGHRYGIKGDVGSFLASQRPPKVIFGDVVEESNPIVSSITWGDFRSGIGKDVGEFPQDLTRAWTSTLHLRHKGHLVLPPLASSLTGHPSSFDIAYDAVWGLLPGTAVYLTLTSGDNDSVANVYPLDTADVIGASVNSLAFRPVDIKHGIVNDSMTLAIATFTDVDWTNNGSSWNRHTEDIQALCFHRGMLWGLGTSDGGLKFTNNLQDASSWTTVATAPWLPGAHTAPRMLEGNGPDGGRALYLAPHDGLYRYEPETETILPVMPLPYHLRGGRGCVEWRNAIYYSAGLAIYEFIPGSPNVVNLVGPDLDDGLANMTNGYITGLAATHEELIASVIVEDASPRGLILGWNKEGWQIKWEGDLVSGGSDIQLPIPFVATAGGNRYNLYWGHGTELAGADTAHLFKMEISTTITNPTQLGTHEYSSGTKTLETPWVVPPADQDWTALSLIVDSIHPTSSETVAVKYATDFSSAFTTVTTKNETGLTRYNLTDSEGQQGVPFRGFRLGLDLTRGTTDTNSPDVRKASLIYRKNFSPLLGFQFNIDLSAPIEGRSAKEVLAQLREFFSEKNPQEFTFKDHDDAEVTYYVTPVSLGGLEKTGQVESGAVQLTVVQTIPNG